MNLSKIIGSLLFFVGSCSFAATESIDVVGEVESGAVYPLSLEVVTGEMNGAQFFSAVTGIDQAIVIEAESTLTQLGSDAFSWSYNRGAGTLPDTCPEGYDAVAGVCAEICQEGYSAAIGGCWENCPKDITDMGAFCTDWKSFKSEGKEVIAQSIVALSCPVGKVNELGLCYEPCEEGFTGVGLMCFGEYNETEVSSIISKQAADQQAEVEASSSTGGISISKEDAPDIRTTVAFSNTLCAVGSTVDDVLDVFGYTSDPLSLLSDTVNDSLDDANTEFNIDTGTAWFTPSIASTVLFDFTADMNCEDDGTVAKMALSVDPSITVQLNTELFDTSLSAMTGINLVIANLSVYELIPFRVYGGVGATVSTPVEFSSVLDRTLPAFYVDDMQYATATNISVTPGVDVWLSAEAYLRVTSIVSFIPDLVKLGAEFYLTVLDEKLPYVISAGLRESDAGGYEIYQSETMTSELATGSGHFIPFLKILGVAIDVFSEEASIRWEGYEQTDELISNETANAVSL